MNDRKPCNANKRQELLKESQVLTLALIKLNSWAESFSTDDGGRRQVLRGWKGYDYRTLNTLNSRRLINDRAGRKSVYLTDDGSRLGDEVLDLLRPALLKLATNLPAPPDRQGDSQRADTDQRAGNDLPF